MSDPAQELFAAANVHRDLWRAGFDEGQKRVKSCAGIIRELCNVLDDLAPVNGPDRNEAEALIKRAGIILSAMKIPVPDDLMIREMPQ